MARKRVELADAVSIGVRMFCSSWIVFFISVWGIGGAFLVAAMGAPLGRWLGASSYSEAFLIDLSVMVIFPIFAVLWTHLHRLKVRRRSERAAFLAQMGEAKLMTYVYNPQSIYRVQSIDEAANSVEVVAVWDADGPVIGGSATTSERSAFRDFDPAAFLRGG